MAAVEEDTEKVLGYIDVSIVDLRYDSSYQRVLEPAMVAKIVRGFDPLKFEPPTVNLRPDGKFYAVDGWTRICAAKEMGMEEICCRVLQIDPAEEPALFIGLNRERRRTRPYDEHKARLAKSDPTTLDIEAVLIKHGVRVVAKRGQAPYVCDSVTALYACYTLGREPLDSAIETIALAWDGAQGLDAKTIRGTTWFYAMIGLLHDVKPKILAPRMGEKSPAALWVASESSIYSNRPHGKYADMLASLHNRNRRSGRVPNWPGDDKSASFASARAGSVSVAAPLKRPGDFLSVERRRLAAMRSIVKQELSPHLITREEAALVLGCSIASVNRRMKRGEFAVEVDEFGRRHLLRESVESHNPLSTR